MNLRRWIRNFFGFTRSQTNGFIFLLPLITFLIFSEPLWRWYQSNKPDDFSDERASLDSLVLNWKNSDTLSIPGSADKTILLSEFNPNLATKEELLQLGFSQGLATRLINYRARGGSFKVKDDLLKLYGMDSAFYEVIEPYVLLPSTVELVEKLKPKASPYIQKELVHFDLNLADSSELKSINGIGSKLAARIIAFREALGGFVSTNQLYEVYGLDSVVVERLVSISFIREDYNPRFINLNSADEDLLQRHPYISKRIARAIITYRFQHGNFNSVDDLRKVLPVNETQLNRIKPYISID